MNYYGIVILYNKKIEDSVSVKSLLSLDYDNLNVIVIDNGSEKYVKYNLKKTAEMPVRYYPMNCNAGLSRAYNYALDKLKDCDKDDIIIWFDDDTPIGRDYFEKLFSAVKNKKYDVFVPVVYGQDSVIYSPNEKGMLKGKYIKHPKQKIDKHKFNAINSCLAVRHKIYDSFRYDELLFLDCVDTAFFDHLRSVNTNFCVLDVIIRQNFFQRNDGVTEKQLWKRFKNRISDTAVYCRKSLTGSIMCLIKIYGWGVVWGLKLRSPAFFYKCFVTGTKAIFRNIANIVFNGGGKK